MALVEPLLDPAAISATVDRLAAEVSADHPDGVVLVGVLKGALCFLADLARAITVPVEIDFISLSRFAPDSGRVRILHDIQVDAEGRDVVLVEAMVDTGLTLAYLARVMAARAPRSVRVCALLDRVSRRIVPHPVDYRGHEVADGFLIGYGFHVGGWYQNLPALYLVDHDAVAQDPGALAPTVYRHWSSATQGADSAEIAGGTLPHKEACR